MAIEIQISPEKWPEYGFEMYTCPVQDAKARFSECLYLHRLESPRVLSRLHRLSVGALHQQFPLRPIELLTFDAIVTRLLCM